MFGSEQATVNLALIDLLLAYSMSLGLRAGALSVAPVGFMAVGAYMAGIFETHSILAPGWSILVATLGCGLAGVVMGLPLSRLSGIYSGIATLALVIVIQEIIGGLSITGGPAGLAAIPLVTKPVYLLIASIVAVVAFFWLDHSFLGIRMSVNRDDPVLASSLRMNVRIYRAAALGCSAAVAGLVGAFYANLYTFVSPGTFSFGFVVSVAAYAIIGGANHWLGPVIGVAILVGIPEALNIDPTLRDVLTGVILAAVMIVAPEGVASTVRRRHALAGLRSRVSPTRGPATPHDPTVAGD